VRRVLIIFFLLFIVSIPIGLLTGIGSSFELTEKRSLAALPSITLGRALDKELYIDLEKYFNDHFAFRGALVKSKNWIDFSLFKTSPLKNVHVGKDGWLFSITTLKDYLKDSCKDRQDLRNLARGLQNIEKMLARNNQTFVFVVAPNKATVYPEYVGIAHPEQGCGKSPYELLLEAFDEFPLKGFIRLDKLLIEAKKDGQLYHKTGTHWNLRGESIAIEAILRYIDSAGRAKSKGPKNSTGWSKTLPEIETIETLRVGDLATMMGLKIDEPVETLNKITYKSETSTEELSPLPYDNNKRRHYRSVSKALPGESLLPSAVIFRDSFMTGPLEILKGSFEKLHVLWSYNMLIEEGQDDLYNSRIVILEMVERNLYHMYLSEVK
jgi:hypothetical protein